MYVVTKVKVHEITELSAWDNRPAPIGGKYAPAKRFKMQIVSGGTEQNDFYANVSGGTNMELQTINPNVFDQFSVNCERFAVFMTEEQYAAFKEWQNNQVE